MAENKQFASAISEAKTKQKDANPSQKQYLYAILSYCQLQLFLQNPKQEQDELKKSLSNVTALKKAELKTATEVPFSNLPFFSSHLENLKSIFSENLQNGNLLAADAEKGLENAELIWNKTVAMELKIAFLEGQNATESVADYLKDIVVSNYQSRKQGDTTNLGKYYFILYKSLMYSGDYKIALEVLKKQKEVYPSNTLNWEKIIAVADTEMRVAGLDNPRIYPVWLSIDSFFSQNTKIMNQIFLENILYQRHLRQLENRYFLDEYLSNIKSLKNLNSRKYNLHFFEQEMLQKNSESFEAKDSWQWLGLLYFQEIKSEKEKLNFANVWIDTLLQRKLIIYANNTYNYWKIRYPKSNADLLKIKAKVDKATVAGLDKNMLTGNYMQAMEYLTEHPQDKVQYLKTLQSVVSILQQKTIEKDFSACMRLTKISNVVFSKEPNYNKAVFNWKQQDYLQNYAVYRSNLGFSGVGSDPAKCKPGIVADSNRRKILNVINYLRRTAGIFDSCELNKEYDKYAQAAALIMSANYLLTHAPEKTLKCYTEDGYKGASHSNLSLGADGIYGLMIQMADDGGGNASCGHRRWILFPNNSVFGVGSVSGAMALYTLGSEQVKNFENRKSYFSNSDYVAWPAPGFFPSTLLYSRWSFSLSGGDFAKASVSVTCNGKVYPVTIESTNGPYGLSTIVWSLSGFSNADAMKYPVTIKIKGISKYDYVTNKSTTLDYSYQIILF